MKVLFVGLGSIGTRHLKNLTEICAQEGEPLFADALRSSNRELPPETMALLTTQHDNAASLSHYDAIFITNPTNLHYKALCELSQKADSLFIEKPIFEKTSYNPTDCIASGKNAYIAAPMRFCKAFMVLKEHISSLIPYSARVICSSYLPDWRKNVDYRTVYSARREMGGGVAIDLIHEWDYLVELFGFPQKCFNLKGTYSKLEITSDDISVYIAQYPKMLAEIHLDYFGREYRRSIELLCENGAVTADFGTGLLTLENGEQIDCSEPVNERYLREMRYFTKYMRTGGESLNSPQKAMSVLKLALGEPVQ